MEVCYYVLMSHGLQIHTHALRLKCLKNLLLIYYIEKHSYQTYLKQTSNIIVNLIGLCNSYQKLLK